ncbi:MAG: type II toxin-antitoxin system RelE/ParE family toxin [Mesorhizobium sp.]
MTSCGNSVVLVMHTIIETNAYLAAAKAAGMSDLERMEAADMVADNPHIGDVMSGTGGCRKVRVPGRGKGKSGGYRIIFVFGGEDIPVFLLTLFGKGQKTNLTKAEQNELAKLVKVLTDTYGKKGKAK